MRWRSVSGGRKPRGESKTMHDVFISHSAKDKAIADAVCAKLEAQGVRCWITPRDVLPGAEWGEAIIDAINECRVMVIIVSSNANASHHIKREVERAVNAGKILIPLRIEDVPLSKSLELFMSTAHWLDALTPPLEVHLQYLAETVKLLLKRADDAIRAAASSACAHCGATIPSTSKFCTACGQPRAAETSQRSSVDFAVPHRLTTPPMTGLLARPYAKIGAAATVALLVVVAAYFIFQKPSAGNQNTNQNSQSTSNSDTRNRRRPDSVQSIEAYTEAIAKNPKDVNAYLGRGDAYRLKSDYDRAISDYSEAIRLDPKNVDAYTARGRVNMMKRDYDKAIADYSEAARLNPNDPDLARVVSRLEDLRKVDKK